MGIKYFNPSVIEALSGGTVFKHTFDTILENGFTRGNTMAIYNTTLKIHYPDKVSDDYPEWRKFPLDYAKLEFDWYMSGDRSIKEISKKAKLWEKMADDDGNVWSNYGWHWKENNQLDRCIKLLKDDIMTRRAVISHYDYNQSQNYQKDTPCNIALNFQYYNDALNCTVFARSIDLVYGYTNDSYCFAKLLEHICREIKQPVGTLTFHITNLHIYDKHFDLKTR